MYKNVTEQRRKTMSHIKGKDTSIEITLRKALWRKGYRYRKNYKKLAGSPDIVMKKYKIAIFCDSEFFHGRDWENLRQKLDKGNNAEYWVKKIEDNIRRDDKVNKQLLFEGWTVIHFWGQEIIKNTDECIDVIEETIFNLQIEEIMGWETIRPSYEVENEYFL